LISLWQAFFAGVGGVLLWVLQHAWMRIQEGRSIAAALGAEIEATLSIAEQRDYLGNAQAMIAAIDAGIDPLVVNFIPDPEALDIAYRSAVTGHQLGLVGPELAGLVTVFFRRLHAIISDLKTYGGVPLAPADKRRMLEDDIQIWEVAVQDGRRAVSGLRAFASKSTLEHFVDMLRRGG
jgi:hypothetical protein